MTEERNPENADEQVEDLDVPAEESEDVKGGAPAKDAKPTESLSLNFSKVEIRY